MPLHDKAFWAIFFFLVGIFIASFVSNSDAKFEISFLITVLCGSLLWTIGTVHPSLREGDPKYIWLTGLSFCIFLGASYYFFADARSRDVNIPFGQNISFTAFIKNSSNGFDSQKLVFELKDPYRGRIETYVPRYPAFAYGDTVQLTGTVTAPMENIRPFLEKDNIFGVVSFPKISLVSTGGGFWVKKILLNIKNFSEKAFARVLPPRESAFMSGLTLGETAEFSKDFKEEMRITGTTHLVALSGYNITIVAAAVMSLLGLLRLSRKWRFIGSLIAISAFVIMTGAAASVVRAAIMGVLVLLAGQVGRAYSFRNAIAVAAFVMVLINPKVLVWDIGFELSFLALLGLVYLRPAIIQMFNITTESGVLNWRENLLSTLAAQLAVLPLILARFGSFSVLSLLTNMLILTFVPLTMFMGFFVVVTTLVSGYLAQLFGFVAHLFVGYEMGVIDFFSQFTSLSISVTNLGIGFACMYYGGLIALVAWSHMHGNKKYEATAIA